MHTYETENNYYYVKLLWQESTLKEIMRKPAVLNIFDIYTDKDVSKVNDISTEVYIEFI